MRPLIRLTRTAVLAFSFSGLLSTATADEPALSVARDDSGVSITAAGKPVLSYLVAGVPFKPYVDELYSPGGVQILRDAPADHLHHHGLMFALVVDGVDFWAERPDRGKQIGGELRLKTATEDGAALQAGFTQRLNWMPPEGKEPLAVEDRSVTVHRGEGIDATLITWQTELRPSGGRDAVTLTGTHYDGLGMRFVESMDEGGRFLYAAREAGPVVRGTNRVTRSKWAAYSAGVRSSAFRRRNNGLDDSPPEGGTTNGGRQVTVAMFDHPDNPRGPAGMFTMTSPFAYLSATPNVWENPMQVKSSQPLRLRYGVAVWDGTADAETVAQMHAKWLGLAGVQKK